jgi:hypothetical protein
MQPGMEKLPIWLTATAPLALLAIIFLGGFWLQKMEKKARSIEKQQMEEPPDEVGPA